MERLTLTESNRRWQVLLQRRDQAPILKAAGNKSGDGGDGEQNTATTISNDDPFDCQSLIIPATNILVDDVLEDFSDRWQQLDYRKIVAHRGDDEFQYHNQHQQLPQNNDQVVVEPQEHQQQQQQQQQQDDDDQATTEVTVTAPTEGEGDNTENGRKNKKRKKHVNSHLSLPPQFDYATRRSEAPADDGSGDRIVNLLNPSETLSYEQELWRLFQEVPTLDEIQEQILQGVQMPRTQEVLLELAEYYPLKIAVDCHALSRIRISDRHEAVPLPRHHRMISSPASSIASTPPKALSENAKTADKSTIRIECWRRHLKRGSSPDSERAVFEFLGSQTLADVHRAIVGLTTDDIVGNLLSSSQRNNDNSNNTTSDAKASGLFFIENTFYTFGPVNYARPIKKWLAFGSTSARKSMLGIPASSTPLPRVPMTETKLKDIPWRLNVRYAHLHRGDVECSLFVTDFRHDSRTTTLPSTSATGGAGRPLSFPLVHDCWPSSEFSAGECDACGKLPVSVYTSTSCVPTQGCRSLCTPCSQRFLVGLGDTREEEKRSKVTG